LTATAGFSQTKKPVVIQQNKLVKIDSLISVVLPSIYQKRDTLTQQIYEANTSFGFVTVIRTANDKNNAPLKKERDLNNALNDYISKIQAQATDGRAIRIRDTTIGTLKAKNFTLKSDDGAGNVQLVDFTLIYTQEATYTFEYVYPEMRADLVKDEYRGFISSIRLSPELQRNDQYLSNAKGLSPVLKIAIYAGGGLALILIIIFVVRRRNRVEMN